MDWREIVGEVKETMEIAEDMLDTGEHIKYARKRIESGEVAKEKEMIHKILHKEDVVCEFFTVLWMIIITMTVIAVKFL